MSNYYEPEVETLAQISRRFSIPLNTLRVWTSQRKFPGIIKFGRGVRVDVSVFRAWVQSKRVDAVRGRGND